MHFADSIGSTIKKLGLDHLPVQLNCFITRWYGSCHSQSYREMGRNTVCLRLSGHVGSKDIPEVKVIDVGDALTEVG